MRAVRRLILGILMAAALVCFTGCLGMDADDIEQIMQEAGNALEQALDTQQADVYNFQHPLHLTAEEIAQGSYLERTQTLGNYYSDYQGYHSAEDWCVYNSSGGNASNNHAVYAIGVGQVAKVSDTGLGTLVVITHGKTPENKRLSFTIPGKSISTELEQGSYPEETDVKMVYSVYYHLKNVTVKKDDWVDENTIIGYLTKPSGMGPHLHFEIRNPYPDGKTLVQHSGNWTMVLPADNWKNYKDVTPTGNPNGYYIHLQKMLNSGFRDPSDFLSTNGSVTAHESDAAEPAVEGASIRQQTISGDHIIISFNPSAHQAQDLYRSDDETNNYALTRVNGGYRITCYLLRTVSITYDDYQTLAAGGTIDSAVGELSVIWSGADESLTVWYDGGYHDLVRVGEYCIHRAPTQTHPEILRYPYGYISSLIDFDRTGTTLEYKPIISSVEKMELFIADDAPVGVFDGERATIRFDDYLANGQSNEGFHWWAYGFYATIQNNKITRLDEISAADEFYSEY